MGNKRHHTLTSYGSNGKVGCKGFNVSMMGFEENECILGQGLLLDTLQLVGTMVWLLKGFFCKRLVHLVQFLKNVFWSGLSIAHAFLVYS